MNNIVASDTNIGAASVLNKEGAIDLEIKRVQLVLNQIIIRFFCYSFLLKCAIDLEIKRVHVYDDASLVIN